MFTWEQSIYSTVKCGYIVINFQLSLITIQYLLGHVKTGQTKSVNVNINVVLPCLTSVKYSA